MYRYILPALLLMGGASALSADSNGWRARQAADDQVKLDKALAGLVPGKPVSCIDPRRYPNTTRIGDKILYGETGRNVFVTDTGGGCFGLRRGDAIVTKSTIGQLCRGDIVQTVDLLSRTPSGSCVFGDFVPYTRPKR